jgi:hypothetical protein
MISEKTKGIVSEMLGVKFKIVFDEIHMLTQFINNLNENSTTTDVENRIQPLPNQLFVETPIISYILFSVLFLVVIGSIAFFIALMVVSLSGDSHVPLPLVGLL